MIRRFFNFLYSTIASFFISSLTVVFKHETIELWKLKREIRNIDPPPNTIHYKPKIRTFVLNLIKRIVDNHQPNCVMLH